MESYSSRGEVRTEVVPTTGETMVHMRIDGITSFTINAASADEFGKLLVAAAKVANRANKARR